jgi:ribonuclease BN (tRNA processing enzyme)
VTLSVTVLGSSGTFATTQRACAGYLLETDEARLWMDAGAGTWRHLLEIVPYGSLDGVLLSHCHPDHTSDLFQALHARQFGGPEPLPPIPLWAPQETLDRVGAFDDSIAEAFDLRRVAAGAHVEFRDLTLDFVGMAHPRETVGMRVSHDGSVFAYSADTGPAADIRTLAGDADLFICEATLQDSDVQWEGHLSASRAGGIASEIGVDQLLLTHLPPGRDVLLSLAQAQVTAKDVAVSLATDGQRFEVGGE